MRRTVFSQCGTSILGIVMGLVIAMTSSVWAVDDAHGRAAVEGLASVHTIVGTTMPDGSAGIDALYADLQAEVEARLQTAGVPIDSAFPRRLVVFVDLFGEDDTSGCRATIDVAIREVSPEPGPAPHLDMPQADTHRARWASCADIDRLVRADTGDLLEHFIASYLESTRAATADIAPRHP